MIEIEEFGRRYRIFEILDSESYPHTFQRFWSYKLKVENEDTHMLDRENRVKTLGMLGSILKIWLWHRPYEFDYCFQKMKGAVEKISAPYNRIRDFSLIEFDKIPEKDLKTTNNLIYKIIINFIVFQFM
jgi:hypothetical protein